MVLAPAAVPPVMMAESRDESYAGRGGRALPVALCLIALVAVAAGWLLLRPDPSPTAADHPTGTPSMSESTTPSRSASATTKPSATQAPTPVPSTPEPSTQDPATQEPTEQSTAGAPAAGQAAAMRTFAQQYVATALTDPEASWQQLTTNFQQDCCDGSVGNYAGYWNTIASATLREVRADPAGMQVSYIITWDPEGERPPEDEQVTLGLVQQGGRYLIDYEL
jgi:hypothetical protein